MIKEPERSLITNTINEFLQDPSFQHYIIITERFSKMKVRVQEVFGQLFLTNIIEKLSTNITLLKKIIKYARENGHLRSLENYMDSRKDFYQNRYCPPEKFEKTLELVLKQLLEDQKKSLRSLIKGNKLPLDVIKDISEYL